MTPTTIFLAQEHVKELAPARVILSATVGDVLFVFPLYPQLMLLVSDGIPESSNEIKDPLSNNLEGLGPSIYRSNCSKHQCFWTSTVMLLARPLVVKSCTSSIDSPGSFWSILCLLSSSVHAHRYHSNQEANGPDSLLHFQMLRTYHLD